MCSRPACACSKLRDIDLMYLSTTDYVQHKCAPGTPGANAFYQMMDGYLQRLDELGAIVAVTADHGMNAKHNEDGEPNVIYLQERFDEWLGDGRCPRDPADHGPLRRASRGARIVRDGLSSRLGRPRSMRRRLAAEPGIELVLTGAEGCARFELPPARMGDLIVISTQDVVLGTRRIKHDLSGLDVPLRSHGGLAEQIVPLLFNQPRREVGRRAGTVAQLRHHRYRTQPSSMTGDQK